MEKYLEQIKKLIAENKAMEKRTPFLEVSLGALQTALANAGEHVAQLDREKTPARPAQ